MPPLLSTLLITSLSIAGPTPDATAVVAVLDGFHRAAASADAGAYFGVMSDDFVFVGTDATERWTRTEFEAFAKPYFDKGSAWTYTSTERHVVVHGDVAWFDEKLLNAKYGETRGSGVLTRGEDGWQIAQYVLSFPIPNDLAASIAEKIHNNE